MIETIALHPKTSSDIESFLRSPGQVLAIVGTEGSGKYEIACQIAASLLDTSADTISDHPSVYRISRPQDKQDIPIDNIRTLISTLKVISPGDQSIRRVVLIDGAHYMNLESQNALLKTLEQPNPDTVFLLTIVSTARILPTILSRAQKLIVHPVDQDSAQKAYKNSFSNQEISSAWNLSEGAAQLLDQLLKGLDEDKSRSVAQAKAFLSSSTYDRLLDVDTLVKDKTEFKNFLISLSQILRALHHSNIKKSNDRLSAKLLKARRLVEYSQQALESNSSPKLIALNLVMNIDL